MSQRGNQSFVWNFFDKSNEKDKIAICHYCHLERSYKTTVTNLKTHLRQKHPEVYKEYYKCDKDVVGDKKNNRITLGKNVKIELIEKQFQMEELPGDEFLEEELLKENSDDANEDNEYENDDSIKEPPNKVKKVMHVYIPEKLKLDDKTRVDLNLLKLIIYDFQPFSIVDDIGFRAYTLALNPSYEIPDRNTFSKNLLPEVYEKRLEEVKMLVQRNAESVCLTVECWTSCSVENYLAITAHFLTKDPTELKSVLIECAELEGDFVGINIYKEIKRILDIWGLYNKVNFLVTDDASNIEDGAKYFAVDGWSHFGCLAQKLNLVVQEALGEIKETITKVERIVSHFRKNTVAEEKLIKHQTNQQNVMQPKHLINSDSTRWNSVFLMLERFVELQETLRAIIPYLRADVFLTMEDWQVMEQILVILKPFYEATKEMSAEQYLTASKAMVLTNSLIKICENYSHLEELHLTVKQLALKLKDGMVRRLGDLEKHVKICLSTVLDPRFKLKAIKDSENVQTLKNELKTKIIDIISKQVEPNTSSQQQEPVPSTFNASCNMPTYSLWSDFDAEVDKDLDRKSVGAQADEELQKYLDQILIKRSECPLKWWNEHKYIYPNLFKLFIEYGNIMATSVPCERMFSNYGRILNDRRARLPSTKIAQLMFLHANKI